MVALNLNGERKPADIIQLFPKKEKDLTATEYTSAGRHKATAAESVRSLDDIRAVQAYFLGKNNFRDYMMFTVGLCTGLRISDLVRLRVSDVLNEDGSFKEYILMREKKTGKLSSNIDDKCLITEAMKIAITKYLETRKNINYDDPLIYSRRGDNGHYMDAKSGWRILTEAGRVLKFPFHLSSHSMRKSFANIAACTGGTKNIDMSKLLSVQHMLKHSDYKTTMRYLSLTSLFTKEARENVSDFVLGKTEFNSLSDALKDEDEDKFNTILNAINKLIELTDDEGGQ